MPDDLSPEEVARLKRLASYETELEEIVQRERALTWFGKRAKVIIWWAGGVVIAVWLFGQEGWERLRLLMGLRS